MDRRVKRMILQYEYQESKQDTLNKMKEATRIYKAIMNRKCLLQDINNQIDTIRTMEMLGSLSANELLEFINSLSAYDTNEKVMERMKQLFGIPIYQSENIDILEEEKKSLMVEIDNLFVKLHNI